ncbi:ATP-binding protein [Streptomyces sp. NPDC004647]|uniref:ATP-binding protein n=1 Tax=Streptomyces sp. NPDC004647 TaxID=3154671 RepID=UPI0033A05478
MSTCSLERPAPPTTAELIGKHGLGKLINHDDINLTNLTRPQAHARDKVRAALEGRADPEKIDDAILVTDEIVGNAFQHGGGPVSLSLDIYEQGAAVRVSDHGTDTCAVPPVPFNPSADLDAGGLIDVARAAENGHGMYLASLLATAMTTEEADHGKTVVALFAFAISGDRPDPAPRHQQDSPRSGTARPTHRPPQSAARQPRTDR